MIEILKEPAEWQRELAEDCFFCDKPTRTWHKKTNTPVCRFCSQINNVEAIEKTKEKRLIKSSMSPGFSYIGV